MQIYIKNCYFCNPNNQYKKIEMKKILVFFSVLALSAGIASAQSFENATNVAKQANADLMDGEYQKAIDGFTAALDEALKCEGDGVGELVSTCKQGKVQAYWAYSNKLVKDGDLEGALVKIDETIKEAQAQEDGEIEMKAEELKLQLNQAIANAKIKEAASAADPQAKVACYNEAVKNLDAVLAANPNDGDAYLKKGQVMSALGKKAEAIECFTKAKENGMDKAADKQLSTIYVKEASAKLKAKDFDGAIAAANKSNEYLENANAYKIAGVACNSKKDLAGAEKYLSKYLEFNPGDAQIKAAVAAIQAQLKK